LAVLHAATIDGVRTYWFGETRRGTYGSMTTAGRNRHSVSPPVYVEATAIAMIHTHPEGSQSGHFSLADLDAASGTARRPPLPIFLVTPEGEVWRAEPIHTRYLDIPDGWNIVPRGIQFICLYEGRIRVVTPIFECIFTGRRANA